MSGATIPSSAFCVFSVNVTGTTAGVKDNSVTETVSSSTATASLKVASPATITVTTLADPTGAAGTCTLRDAIRAANTMTATNNCPAGTGNDTIVFQPGLTGTIMLASTLPAIVNGETLTIQGPGITIDGGGTVQLMQVNTGATVSLQFLTLENGILAGASGSGSIEQGGAIYNLGTLTISNCTLSNNQAIGGSAFSSSPPNRRRWRWGRNLQQWNSDHY